MITSPLTSGSVLVTGGTGFIGTSLCHLLAQKGFALTVLSRNPEAAVKVLPPHTMMIKDLADLPVAPCSYLINLAGEPLATHRWTAQRKEDFRVSRINLTRQLYETLAKRGTAPTVVISGSAVGVYGNRGNELLVESSSVGSGFAADLCRDWEEAGMRFAELGARVCLLRTGVVLDRGGGALQKMLPAFSMGLGGRMGDGSQWMSWIHRFDLIRLILFCLERESLSGPVNGVAPQPVTNNQFTQTLAIALRRPARIPVPRIVLRLMLGEMADELLLASQCVSPEAATKAGFQFSFLELTTALEDILCSKK
jgi:uncharacterized protein (TIGR01777 family)